MQNSPFTKNRRFGTRFRETLITTAVLSQMMQNAFSPQNVAFALDLEKQ